MHMTLGRWRERGAVALVTGASSGIGHATARALASEGFRVVLSARRLDRIAEASKEIGPSSYPLCLDVRDRKGIDDIFNQLPVEFRQIDVLVNNAGHAIGGTGAFNAEPSEIWDDLIDTNVRGLMRVTNAVIGGMISRGAGDIVNIGSVAGIRSTIHRAVYGASKAAVHMFSENLRLELAGTGVRVTEVLPGLTRTEFSVTRLRGDQEKAASFLASGGTPLKPEDVARAILFALTQPAHVSIAQLVIVPSTRV